MDDILIFLLLTLRVTIQILKLSKLLLENINLYLDIATKIKNLE